MDRKERILFALLRPLVVGFLKCAFGYRYEKIKALPDHYIVLSNHTTDYDPLLVAASFPDPLFFVASEHIARWPVAGKLLSLLFHPIYRSKGASAASTVMEILRHTRKGHNVCMFAEGARTWNGVTGPILPSTAKLVKAAGCGLVTYKLQGGYFVSPRWGGASIRRGCLRGGPVNIYTPEMLRKMSVDEVYQAITTDLHEDAYARQLADPKPYRSKKRAMFMERLLFICPKCGLRDTLRSRGSTVRCHSCGLEFHYDAYGMLDGLPYRTVKELSHWQDLRVKEDIDSHQAYTAESGTLTALQKHTETPVAQGAVTMTREALQCGDFRLPLSAITDMNIHGQKAIVFTANRQYYELRPAVGFNALKFYLFYNGCKEKEKEKVG